MKTYIYIGIFALGLQCLCAEAIYAQGAPATADTLRRSLNVITTERSTFPTRQPLDLSPVHPQVRYAQAGGAQTPQLAMGLDGLLPSVEALQTVTPLPTLFAKSEDIGYISAELGLRYNARLAAGLRAINRKDELLDLSLSGLWSDYKHGHNGLSIPVKEWGIGLGTHWAKDLGNSVLDLSVSARHGSHNLYGTSLLHSALGMPGELWQSLVDAMGSQSLSHTLIKADLILQSSPTTSSAWRYRLNPSLIYASKGDLSELSARAQINLGRQLVAGHLLGIELTPHLLRYSTKAETDNKGSMSIGLAPYWETATHGQVLGWSLRAGVGVTALSRFYDVRDPLNTESDKLWAIYPVLRGRLYSVDNRWDVEASLSGGGRGNSLSSILEVAPHLSVGSLASAGLVRFGSDLKATVSPMANLKLGLHAGYEVVDGYADPVVRAGYNQALPQSSYFTYRYRGIEAKHFSVGGSVAYEATSLFRIATQLTYHSWSSTQVESVGGVPSLSAGIDLSLQPLSALKLNFGYELQHGTKYQHYTEVTLGSVGSGTSVSQVADLHRLPAMHYLRASATYMLDARWALQASGHVSLNTAAVRHYGYPMQNVSVSLGASYRF